MELKIAKERVLMLIPQFTQEEAKDKAWAKKITAFDTISKFSGLLSRPKDEDFEITYQELRYQPFWHIASKAHYVYDRNSFYQYDITHDEVKTVTVEGKDFEVANGHLHVPVVEHCLQDLKEEVLIDALNGDKKNSILKDYLNKTATEIKAKNIQDALDKEAALVPPQSRVSGVIRELLAKMIQGIQADVIFEEEIEITCIDLYYRPIYAFQFHWKSKDKTALLEFDAVTGAISNGTRTFKEFVGMALDRDFLFDIGADAAGMFIPGGSIAVKAAKKVIDAKKR